MTFLLILTDSGFLGLNLWIHVLYLINNFDVVENEACIVLECLLYDSITNRLLPCFKLQY